MHKITILSTRLLLINTIVLFAGINQSFAQDKKYNYDDLSPITIGIHRTNYDDAKVFKNLTNDNNSTYIDLRPAKSFFIDYRLLKYKNHALKLGLFFKGFNNKLSYNGSVIDSQTNQPRQIDSRNINRENAKTYEITATYSYLIKLNSKFFLDLAAGISHERNNTLIMYEDAVFFSNQALEPYQTAYYSIYFTQDRLFRYNLTPSLGYKTNYGMVNLGIKYSAPTKVFLTGQYEFYNAGEDSSNTTSYGVYELSGKYLSTTLSFTPSKKFFKKKVKK